jgi:hypothetical protein
VGQASVVTRMRTGDIRSIPLTFWLFGFLTLLYAYLLVADRPFDRADDVLTLLIIVAPLAFATAIAWAAPVDRRFLWGAAFIAVSALANLIEMALARFAFFSFDWGLGLRPSSLTWGLELIGVVLIALAIGRIQQRRNWMWPLLGLAIFVIGDIENAFYWAGNPFPEEELGVTYPIASIAITFIGGLTVLSWSYLLGSAVEHGRRLFAIGAGIFVALSAFGLADEIVYAFLYPNSETADFTYTSLFFSFVRAAGWVALIVAALGEVPRRSAAAEPAT